MTEALPPPRHAALLPWGALALLGCAAPEPTVVAANGAWADDDSAVLVAASSRSTRSDAPWYYDPDARDWEVVFFQADPDPVALAHPTELARFPDLADSGGILAAPLWWLRDQAAVLALEYHQAVVYDLATADRRPLELPEAEARRLFLLDAMDLRPYAGPVAVAPSPDGEVVAVHLDAALFPDGPLGDLLHHHAVAFYTLDGAFLAAAPLDPFRGDTHQLRRPAPLPDPMPPAPAPPAHQALALVPSHHVVTFVWEADGEAVVFARSGDPDGAEPLALRIDTTGHLTEVSHVPAVALPAPGGPVRSDGTWLLVHTPEGDPDAASLRLHPTDTHHPWGTGPDVPVEAIGPTW